MTQHGLFPKDNIEDLVPGVNVGVIELNGFLKVRKLFNSQLSFYFTDDVFQVMAFHIDDIDVCLYRLKLCLILSPKLGHNGKLLFPFITGENAGAGYQNDKSISDAEQLHNDIHCIAF